MTRIIYDLKSGHNRTSRATWASFSRFPFQSCCASVRHWRPAQTHTYTFQTNSATGYTLHDLTLTLYSASLWSTRDIKLAHVQYPCIWAISIVCVLCAGKSFSLFFFFVLFLYIKQTDSGPQIQKVKGQ